MPNSDAVTLDLRGHSHDTLFLPVSSQHHFSFYSYLPMYTNRDAQALFHVPVDPDDPVARLDPVPASSTRMERREMGTGVQVEGYSRGVEG